MSKLKMLLLVSGLICVNILFASNAVHTANINIDNTIAFQGYLTDPGGRPFFGTVDMNFGFYRQETGTGDTGLITRNNSLRRAVQIFNGQYATKLALPPDILTLINQESNVWVEISIGPSGEANRSSVLQPLTPRVQLTSAVHALTVRGIYYDNDARVIKIGQGYRGINYSATDGASFDMVISGNVGIGTADVSQAKLTISGHMGVAGNVFVSGNIVPRPIVNTDGHDSGVYGAVWN